MERKIELDETRALEVQQSSMVTMAEADVAIAELERATKAKIFSPDGEMVLAEVEEYGKRLSGQIKAWVDFIGPVVQTAKELHSMMVERRDAIKDPLEEKKKRAALAVGAYRYAHDEDRRKREEEELRRRQKEEEDQRLAEAAQLEKNGAKEEAAALLDQPIAPPPVTFAAPEKTKGVGQRGNWMFEVTDESKIPDRFWVVDSSKIGAEVRTYKDKSNIPGIRVWFQPSASFSSK